MTEEEALRLMESLTVGERKEIPLEDFAWPEERKFPCDTQDHVDSCAKLLGHAPEAEQGKIKARAIRIAKRHGFTLPQSWQDEKESASTHIGKNGTFQESNQPVEPVEHGRHTLAESAGQRPQKKIGTLPICFLEYNARSLNGRIYPKATCDAIYRAAQQTLADSNALPPTTFVSHEAANGNVNTDLVGHVSKVWQVGSKFWANIDLADTTVARDMLGLVENGALRSGSMRVQGVQLMHDRNYDLPLVVVQEGVEPKFAGIDLTTNPGLVDIARIPQALYESNGQEPYQDAFMFESLSIENREEPPAMTIPIYVQAALGTLQEAKSSREAHTAIHDHIAGVMDEAMGKACHGSESARYKALIEGQLDEAGKAIAMKHAARLAMAHDESAKQLNMKCEGCYADVMPNAPSDTDNDGDNPAGGFDPDHDGESHNTPPAMTESTKEDKPLTEQEMLAALAAKGFKIEAPKTEEQKKLEALEALIAEQNAKIAQLQEAAPTSRQTLAAPNQLEESSTLQEEQMYEEGDYLKGQLAPKNWQALSNRRVPWPAGLDPKLALHEMAPFLAHTLNAQEAHARGRNIDAFIRPDEIM